MRVRPLQPADIPVIQSLFESSQLPYDMPNLEGAHIEAVLVVEGDDGRLLMACAAERILQLYLWTADFEPAAKLHAIRLLHSAMAVPLHAKGYREVNAFLPPAVERAFGRRLCRMFGWARNWISYTRRV